MTNYHSPSRLLVIIFISVFLTEAFIMFFLSILPPLSTWMWAMFDATLLITLLSPVLYFFTFRPLILQISERKQAEKKTKLAYLELNQIFNTAADGMRLIDKDFNVLRVNETFSTLSGVSRDEATGEKCHEVFRGPMCFTPDCPLTRILGGEKRVEYEVEKERKDGTKIPCIVTGTPFRGPGDEIVGIVEDFKDITTHKQAEEALRAALRTAEDERLKSKSIIESIGEPLGIIDTDFRFMYQNKVHRDSYGEHLGKLCYKAIKNRDEICEGCQLTECFRDGNVHSKERVVPRGDGPPLYVVNTASPLRDSNGKIVAGIELIGDITEWRQAEEAIKLAHAELDQIFNTSADGMRVVDKEFNVLRVNNTFAKLSGIGQDEAVGKKCYEVFRGSECHTPNCPLTRILGGEDRVEIDTEKERNDGIRIPCIVTATPFRGPDGALIGIVENFTDITERKKLEGQLLQAQKMEAVGQLAGGIAHDFNNILTAIIGFGTLLNTEMSKDDPLRNYVKQILASSERAAKLTQALLAFSRKQIISLRTVNLNEIIVSLETLLSRLIGEDIELSTVLVDEDLTVMADSTQIEQVLMNLATNARDAMPDGGQLTIRTELAQFDYEYIKTHGYGKPGPYALISVEDAGVGMDVKTRDRIFEPFYTTKEVGKGTGLGLAMAYGIIKQHDGYINVYSEPGKGTTFKIYLPLIRSKVEEEKIANLYIMKRGTETILVAEDDTQVRDLTKHILEGFGYQVMEAGDGEEAISVFNDNKDRIQLLILDVVMPKKNGKEVYDEIKKIRPDIKAIFTSGYNAEIIHKKGILEKGLGFITKPFLPQELLKKVREFLDST